MNPTTFAIGTPTASYASSTVGPYSAGTTVNFWLSTTTASTGIVGASIGTTVLEAGSQNLANPVTLTIASGTTAGAYYILSNSVAAPTSYQLGPAITVSTATPSFTLTPSTTTPGASPGVSGSGWDAGATVSFTIGYPNVPTAPVPLATSIGTLTATAAGGFSPTAFVTMPSAMAAGTYTIVAQETSGASLNYPITADFSLTIEAAIGTSHVATATLGEVTSTPGLLGDFFTLSGGGFTAGATVSSVTVGGVATTFAPAITTVSATGAFTITVTLSAKIAAQGPATIVLVTSPASAPASFPAAIVVSNPGVSTTLIAIDEFTGLSSGQGFDPLLYEGWGFTASTSGYVYFDGVATSVSTDSNGFLIDAGASVPALPAGTYSVFADISNGVAAATTFTIQPLLAIVDSGASPLSGEYAVSGSTFEVFDYGLAAFQAVDVVDTGLLAEFGTGSIDALCQAPATFCGFLSLNFFAGSFNGVTLQANAVGAIDFTYTTIYPAATPTGASESVSLLLLPSGTSVVSANYLTVGAAVVAPATSYAPGAAVALSISGLIPNGAAITPETAGYAGPFGIQVGGTPQKFSTGHYYFLSSATGTASVSFANPGTSGTVATLSVLGNVVPATGAANGNSATLFVDHDLITSVPSAGATAAPNAVETFTVGGSGTTGSPWKFYPDPAGLEYAVVFDLYGFPAGATVTVTYSTSSGPVATTLATDANGAALYVFTPPATASNVPTALVYSLVFASGALTISGQPSSYWELLTAASYAPSPFVFNLGSPATDYASYFGASAPIGTSVTVYVNSFLPTSPLILAMAPTSVSPPVANFVNDYMVASNATDVNGDTSFTFTVPSMINGIAVSGTWNVWVVQEQYNAITGPFVVSGPLTIEVPSFTLFESSTPAAASAGFPGQLVQFLWTPGAAPTPGFPTEVTVLLNGTAYTTEPAVLSSGMLAGSFQVPNGPIGSYWIVSLMWTQNIVAGGSSTPASYTSTYATPFFLAQGNGALLTGISPGDIATIVAAVSATVTSSMKVPLQELNASVVAIQGAVVEITTAFGTMTATLNAINATVSANAAGIANIQNGLVTIDSTLGTMTAALSAIGATVTTVSDNVIVLNTTLGQMNTTLTALNANVASIAGGVATLTTDVGQIQVSLAAIGAQLTTVTGDLATISSTLGTMTATLSSIGTMVTSISNGVATIQTDLGTLTGNVTAISNGIATIQTKLGTLQTSVNAIPTSAASPSDVSTLTTLLYVVIVLVIITLALAAVLLTRAGRRPPSEPPKAYEAPKTP